MSAPEPRHTKSLWSDVLRVLFGPWPLRPLLSTIFLFMVSMYALNSGINLFETTIWRSLIRAIPYAVTPALITGATLYLGRRITNRRDGSFLSRTAYLTVMILSGATFGSMSYVARLSFEDEQFFVRGLTYYISRGIIVIATVHVVAGISEARLTAQIEKTEEALAQVTEQRRVVIDSEERVRDSVARFLHDSVQAQLVTISMQLRGLDFQSPDVARSQVASIVEALEQLRGSDVREASRRLSPDIRTIGIRQALEQGVSTFAATMMLSISVDESINAASMHDPDLEQVSLGIYRVVEQAILNAAVHGHAQRATVHVRANGRDVELRIEDDGVGLPDGELTIGSGLSIVRAWVGILQGTWSLQQREEGGAVLAARLPLPSHRSAPA